VNKENTMDTNAIIPGRNEKFPVTVEHGTAPLRPSTPAGAGQTDATLYFDNSRAAQEAEREVAREAARLKKRTREIDMPDAAPADVLPVVIGDIELSRSNADGWERKFSGGSAYVVTRHGEVLKGYAAFEALAEAVLSAA
jgi:hypothetical protein